MLTPANGAVCPREKYRRAFEACAIGNHAGLDVMSGVWAFDHNRSHRWPPSIRRMRASN
jgi:hypothetical protein